MASLGVSKFRIVPRDLEDRKLGTLVSTAHIYDAGTSTLSSLLSDKKGTVQANPVTAIDGGIDFYGFMPSFDVVITLTDGSTITKAGMQATDTRITTDSSITQGNVIEGAGQKTADITKTLSWSIAGPEVSADIQFVRDSDNPSIDSEIEIEDIIPAFAKIIDLQVVTTIGNTNALTFTVGSSTLGTEYHTEASVGTVDTILQYAAGALGEVAASSSVGSIFVNADINGPWEDQDGKWRLSCTYIDYGQLL